MALYRLNATTQALRPEEEAIAINSHPKITDFDSVDIRPINHADLDFSWQKPRSNHHVIIPIAGRGEYELGSDVFVLVVLGRIAQGFDRILSQEIQEAPEASALSYCADEPAGDNEIIPSIDRGE